MAKRKERITIYGETFTIENKTVNGHFRYFNTLDECYAKPSVYKQYIYEDWYNWFRHLGANANEHGIAGYNCMQFSYGGYFTYNGVRYYAHITKCYNRLYRVAGE